MVHNAWDVRRKQRQTTQTTQTTRQTGRKGDPPRANWRGTNKTPWSVAKEARREEKDQARPDSKRGQGGGRRGSELVGPQDNLVGGFEMPGRPWLTSHRAEGRENGRRKVNVNVKTKTKREDEDEKENGTEAGWQQLVACDYAY